MRLGYKFLFNLTVWTSTKIQQTDKSIRYLFTKISVILDPISLHRLSQFCDNQHQSLADIPFLFPKSFFNSYAMADLSQFVQRTPFNLSFLQRPPPSLLIKILYLMPFHKF